MKWTESKVFEQLRHVWPSPAHIRLPQVRNGTGFSRRTTRTCDALVASVYPSRGLWMAGVEIKVSRSDWKKELADPEKAAEIGKYCRNWWIAAPAGVVPAAEVPDAWGLVECDARSAQIVKAAPAQECQPPDLLLLCSILRATEKATVPADAVQDRINEVVERSMASRNDTANWEHRRLKEQVERFEEASGVQVKDNWDYGQVGQAVKLIREAGSPERALQQLQKHALVVTRAAEQINEVLAEAEQQAAKAGGSDEDR